MGGEGGIAGGASVAGEGGEGGVGAEGGTGAQGGVGAEGGSGAQGGAGAEGGSPEPPPVDAASLVVLDLAQRPYTQCESYKIGADYARDAAGIPLKLYRGEYYDHPVLAAQAGLEWLACYRDTNDPWYYDHAIAAGHHLIDTSDEYDGAMFFPYEFDFRLHSNAKNVLRAPWYSGMAQGQVLSLFSRLGELSGDPEWQVAAAATLKSFDHVRGEVEPWIIALDDDSSLWIEEYPAPGELHVLNGFMFAMFGLYDYFAWSGDTHAQERFLQSLHTLRHNVERFREPGSVSAYCLAHRAHSTFYHGVHIDQLRAITRMTNDPYFASVADIFASDSAP